ncbi:MAG TPA: DUF2752 domain-containing protein [Thermoanaerobaculales bacterium]|nr:DUF2752 domain-containing protein [Gemmatimonadales bacterium]HOC43426.1 DUF2752 domain-containing protein [Thermoanaerobaculales bacterium]HPA82190.1 DUF2752 domain-containing protein [Thermoanaerobaculales bacterium]HQL30498.1 DUF2752 domain-containing protein [Thermoanaerobaculales bacterium]HQN95185.1 DUF2752 domain-containing protein [Thermoanaerobaculales bacterium]
MPSALRWTPLSVAERQLAWVWGGLALSVVALKPLWPLVTPFLRPCLFRSITGVPCPSCGATRSVLALLDGDVPGALLLNPLVFAASIAFLAGGVVAPLWAWRRCPAPRLAHPLPRSIRLGLVALILLNWAWLIVHL